MLILCTGPDTFRAQEKALELVQAFQQKHDIGGSSIESFTSGKDAVKALLERINTPSLFSPKRLIRVSDLLTDVPKAAVSPLVQALSRDSEQVIVISTEEKMPPEVTMKQFAGIPKLVTYEFVIQRGSAFTKWAWEQACKLNISDQGFVRILAEICDGDAWLLHNELVKVAAGNRERPEVGFASSKFELADRYLDGGTHTYDFVSERDAPEQALSTLIQQARASIRVRDKDTDGIHPYVLKKMQASAKNRKDGEKRLALLLRALILQRVGYGNEEEVSALL
ncbi:MAG: hypothetical protein WCV84_03330 [Patescibacteria group bacterium]